MAEVYLSLGSNLGDREGNIRQALGLLGEWVRIERVSSLYETEPMYLKEQPWFLNLVCTGETELSPQALLDFIGQVEKRLGRVRGEHYGPRTIDIDILLYDALVLDTPSLQLPHPRLAERAFVLVPLEEIAPHLVHPVLGLTAGEMLGRLGPTGEVRLYRSP